jgi:hypothetical protein
LHHCHIHDKTTGQGNHFNSKGMSVIRLLPIYLRVLLGAGFKQ